MDTQKLTGTLVGMTTDPAKHARYNDYYKSNDLFWGIGIENETYLQFTEPKQLTAKAIYENHKPERYSVNYFSGLNPEYKELLKLLYPISDSAIALAELTNTPMELNQIYDFPIYMNSHTLQKTDKDGNHATTYEKVPKPNPNFQGQTIHDLLVQHYPEVFHSKFKVNYTYDGDTVEFMTQHFYKTTVNETIKELTTEKQAYLQHINSAFQTLNILPHLGPLQYPQRNEPFVCFHTNLNNIGIFNNGTYHLNFTMPTLLDHNKNPANPVLFVQRHKAAIRYIQYLEPLIIALYGTPDPFSNVSDKYSKASQRCAVSRYIGIGTYNTDTMETGKILSVDTNSCKAAGKPYWWYTQYTKTSHYNPLTKIGVDINFNKHGAHGIEIRFLDWFPEDKLQELMTTLVHVMDHSLRYGMPADPTVCPIWNGLVVKMLQQGRDATLSEDEYDMYKGVFQLPGKTNWLCFRQTEPETKCLEQTYLDIAASLKKNKGPCFKTMI